MISQEVTRSLQQSGYKLTRQRRVIIEALSENGRPLTALELLGQVKQKLPTISHDTLYRNLEVLSSIGVVNRIRVRGGGRFELDRHHHHFICLECGEVTCLEGCPIGPGQLAEARNRGFAVVHHYFEVSGYCTRCQPCEGE